MSSVEQAYAEVQRVTRARAKNFAYGIMVLPREKRRAIAAIYAFARQVDDLADGDLPSREKRERLEAVRAGLHDLEQTRYATFDDLRGYCGKVAGAVGVACIAVYGSDDIERANTLGVG